MLQWAAFFVKNSYTEFHENPPTGGSIADTRSQPDGRTDRQVGFGSTQSAPSSGTVSKLLAGLPAMSVCLFVPHNAQTGSTAHPPFLASVNGSFPGIKQSQREVNFHVVPRLRMCGAITLLPLHACMAWTEKILPSPLRLTRTVV